MTIAFFRRDTSVQMRGEPPSARIGRIIRDVKAKLLAPERLSLIRDQIVERRALRDQAVAERCKALEQELSRTTEKLCRLYEAIEAGGVDLDDDLKQRIQTLKHERDTEEASRERMATQAKNGAEITPEKIEAFSALMRDKLENSDTQARKAYLRAVISCIEVDDEKVRVIGEQAARADVIAGRQTSAKNDSGFIRKWRAKENETANLYLSDFIV